MKKHIVVILSLFSLLSACAFVGFYAVKEINTEEPVTNTYLSVLVDKTDATYVELDSILIADLYGYDRRNLWNGSFFRLIGLTDRQYSRIIQYSISPGSRTKDLIVVRKKEVSDMLRSASAAIEKINASSEAKDNSILWEAIIRELNYAANVKGATRKVILIYSDLLENSSWFSVYKDGKPVIPETDRDEVRKFFLEHVEIQNLSGIEIHIIHKSRSYKEDEVFKYMSQLYMELLQEYGATVIIGANFLPS